MIEPRIYRAAFLPALVAIFLVAFSFESRPPALPQGLPGDVLFDADGAISQAQEIASATPDRRPGTDGNRELADLTRRSFVQRQFATTVDRWEEDDGTELINVVGTRAGASRRQIVIVAARDSNEIPDLTGSAADTAALLEVANVLQGRAPRVEPSTPVCGA